MDNSSRKPARRLAWRYRALLAVIVLGGVALSLTAFVAIWLDERDASERTFQRAAQQHLVAVEEQIQRIVDAVETLGEFFESSTVVDPQEFNAFAHGVLKRIPSVRALQWMPRVSSEERAAFEAAHIFDGRKVEIWERNGAGERVRAGSRSDHFPVLFTVPEHDREAVLGFDIGSEERRREAIDRAIRTGQAVASRPIVLQLDRERLPGVLLVRPVFRGGQADDGRRLLGFASTALIGKYLIEQALVGTPALGIRSTVYERHSSGRGQLIHQRASGADTLSHPWIARILDRSDHLVRTGILQVAGQQWEVEMRPAPGHFFGGATGSAFAVLLGGLLVTSIVFLYVRSLYRAAVHTLRSNEALKLRDRAIEASTNAVMILSREERAARIEYVNAAFERITGYTRNEVLGRDWRVLHDGTAAPDAESVIQAMLRSRDEGAITIRSQRKDGSPFWSSVQVAPVRGEDGQVTHYVGILEDVSETRSYQERLEHQATHDELTGLPNRALLLDRIGQGIAHAQRQGCTMGVLFIDLDHFKRINDGYGHNAGDEVLRALSLRLGSVLRAGDTVARYGGDEFIVVVNDHSDEEGVLLFCRRLVQAISEPMHIGGNELLLSCSVGVSLYPRDGSDAQTLLQQADSAMYQVKDEGRGAVRFYTHEISSAMHERLSLEQSLRRALERREFFLEYQPRVDLRNGAICGAEALLRWEHPQLGRVAPGQFIGPAEDTGLIVPIGEWALEEACRKAAEWAAHGPAEFTVSVNLSPRQFRQKDMVAMVSGVLRRTGLHPSRLQLEITESSMMQDVDQATHTLRSLNALGVRLALDDFGTGYSSLAYLKTFPIDDLKIDRSFVRDVTSDADDAQISRAIIGLAHNLGLRVVAEGVETLEQLRFLCENGCDEGQGFFFARPLHEADLDAWMAAWTGLPEGLSPSAVNRVVPIRR